MASPTFADTHNMIAFFSKSDASAGFDQIVDFLNAHTIQYTLMVNLTIYVSCIKKFWASDSIKKVNNAIELRALIDRKKVVITEDVIRQAPHLDDADGVECFPNEEIFAELARMGYEKPPPKLTFFKAFFSAQWKFLIHTLLQCVSAKRTAWNEFSCSMASAVICFATGLNPLLQLLWMLRRMHPNRGRIKAIDADEDITLEVNDVEPTVFDDEKVTMTMAQTLIKMKAEKARILDTQMAQRLHDEEIKKLQPGMLKKKLI
uniref:Synaptobrevin, longin-like domain protein n=1 Tax=Tanacetum cinerariifolium TaxID=118510 RepID=A0A6L2J9M7_TANCI|nr:hypothetical protein [Tanacetum cinerariifolium]